MSNKAARVARRAAKRAVEPEKWARIRQRRRGEHATAMEIPAHIRSLAKEVMIKNEDNR